MSYDIPTRALWLMAKRDPTGGTFSPTTFEPVPTGYVVAAFATQDSFGIDGCARCVDYALTHGLYVGWWLNEDGIIQFDAVHVLTNLREATDRGRAEKQRAIFDIEKQDVIFI